MKSRGATCYCLDVRSFRALNGQMASNVQRISHARQAPEDRRKLAVSYRHLGCFSDHKEDRVLEMAFQADDLTTDVSDKKACRPRGSAPLDSTPDTVDDDGGGDGGGSFGGPFSGLSLRNTYRTVQCYTVISNLCGR